MLLSVFTASDNPRFLGDCYDSLKAQTLGEWEWIVLLSEGQQGLAADASRTSESRSSAPTVTRAVAEPSGRHASSHRERCSSSSTRTT